MGLAVAASVASALALAWIAAPAPAAGPPPLSADRSPAKVDSSRGSGIFGAWTTDRWGLPAYRYDLDPDRDARTAQPELRGNRDAWHQLGNDHVVATAHNRGWVQLWSQDRTYQWTNRAEPELGHYGGGYGYLRTGNRTISTLYADRPQGAQTERLFGTGHFGRRTAVDGVDIREAVYAPYGDDPLLLHDVEIRNTSSRELRATWYEFWDVNPYRPVSQSHRGLTAPAWDAQKRILSVGQVPEGRDNDPLHIFAAPIRGAVDGFETHATRFFGTGGRANPDAVAADRLGGGIAPPVPTGSPGTTLFAMRSPVVVAPGDSVTLRYAYGAAHDEQIPALVERWRAAPEPLERSQRAWRDWLPRADLEGDRTYLQRELQWDAYMLRSGVTYEEACGNHILSQGGYYQYDNGHQIAYRDPLQHVMPLIHAEPEIVRETIRYSAKEQPRSIGQIPYGMTDMCTRLDLGSSNDLDLWLLLTAAEYGLASRDTRFFDERIAWADGGEATLWEHLKAAYAHQESQRGPNGGYIMGSTGDWSDFSTQATQMTESILVSAQLTYVYPRLAELADLRGDRAFAAALRADAAELQAVMDREWVGKGWYTRGYSHVNRVGTGAIYGEPQPWALLGGVPSRDQANTLVRNIRRFLTGIGAPPQVKGPAKIGSSQSPSKDDPEITEYDEFTRRSTNNAVFVGGVWYAVNGWLTWALGELEGVVPRATEYAMDELERNTLAAHATAFPDHWAGVISVDDMCNAHYENDPARCGIQIATGRYNTQLMHQPAWSMFDTIKLAGIDATRDGYRIDPHLPMRTFSLRLPRAGLAYEDDRVRGYLEIERSDKLAMAVRPPDGMDVNRAVAYADGRRVAHRVADGFVRFDLPAMAGRAADWAVTFAPTVRCASRRRFEIRVPEPRGRERVRRPRITVAGRRLKVRRRRGRHVATVDLRGRPREVVRVRIVARTSRGRTVRTTRAYRTCVRRGTRGR